MKIAISNQKDFAYKNCWGYDEVKYDTYIHQPSQNIPFSSKRPFIEDNPFEGSEKRRDLSEDGEGYVFYD